MITTTKGFTRKRPFSRWCYFNSRLYTRKSYVGAILCFIPTASASDFTSPLSRSHSYIAGDSGMVSLIVTEIQGYSYVCVQRGYGLPLVRDNDLPSAVDILLHCCQIDHDRCGNDLSRIALPAQSQQSDSNTLLPDKWPGSKTLQKITALLPC